MNIDITARKAHDPEEPHMASLLAKLQGNILKGHGRDHAVYAFFRFVAPPGEIRAALIPLAKRLVTPASKQLRQARDMKTLGVPGTLFGSILFSAGGYRALGFHDRELAMFDEGGARNGRSHFREGMKACRSEFRDPDPTEWDGTFHGDVHMLVILADDDATFLQRQARALLDELSAVASVTGVEHGHALRNEQGEGIEHFGYVDGRSQPIFLKTDLEAEGSTNVWNPVEPLESVLVPDPGVDDTDAFGSFYVFRKLEQNVLGFRARERELSDVLGLRGEDRKRAGAMAVGRFRDGTPLALSPTPCSSGRPSNDFRFDGTGAEKCPFHAHVRKVNPRGDVARLKGVPENAFERSRRIVRRGMPYGDCPAEPRGHDLDHLPTRGVGLLFACFQANIGEQFAFIQSRWVNAPEFVQPVAGHDPVAANPAFVPSIPQRWPTEWGKAETEPFGFGHFVTFKGGEFFFAPSIPFLETLKPKER